MPAAIKLLIGLVLNLGLFVDVEEKKEKDKRAQMGKKSQRSRVTVPLADGLGRPHLHKQPQPYFVICTRSLFAPTIPGSNVCGDRQLSKIPTCCTQDTVHFAAHPLCV